jgi:hypothetical protein
MKYNTWITIKDQSLAVYARNAGFDLAIYKNYVDEVQKELRRRTINEAVDGIRDSFEDEAGYPLPEIKKGVYAIALANPLSINYRYQWSPVIYIGMGNIDFRIKQHFQGSLFDLMQSLSGANFDFSFACPQMKGREGYYKHIEFEMLEYFSKKIGGLGQTRRFPILNKNAGSDRSIQNANDWWAKPLKAAGKKPLWALEPTEHSDFAPLD